MMAFELLQVEAGAKRMDGGSERWLWWGHCRERLEPQKEENVSCIFWRSWELGSLCPFHIKSVMCSLIEARVKHELRVISIWLIATFSSS